jgi:uncharacterized phage-associated protein
MAIRTRGFGTFREVERFINRGIGKFLRIVQYSIMHIKNSLYAYLAPAGLAAKVILSPSRRARSMASVFDVASYILSRQGPMTTWKLQKLVYYSQAWSLVWDERPLFPERIEAWANGPVCPDLYSLHRGQFRVATINAGDASNLSVDELDTIEAVLSYYGDKSAQWLSDLTHAEAPWRKARGNLPQGTTCCAEITHDEMAAYYESLPYDS